VHSDLVAESMAFNCKPLIIYKAKETHDSVATRWVKM